MDDCIFCKIVEGEMDSEVLFETENVVAFLDKFPRALGHSLVIPKTHNQQLMDVDDELVCELMNAVKKVEKMLEESLNPDAFTVGINDGEASGQEIPHLHINIIPRFEGDGGKPIHAVIDNTPEKEVPEVAEEIRKTKK